MKSFARTLAASLLVVSVFYSAAACSSGSSVAGGRDSFISQLCKEYMPCCTQAGKPSDGSQCRAFYAALAGGANYDAAAANKCLDEVRAASKSATFCEEGIGSPNCSRVFASNAGTRKPGENCGDDDDCAPSAEGRVECASLTTPSGTIKRCQLQVVGIAGDTPCVGTVDGSATLFNSNGDTEIPTRGYLCYAKDGLRCSSTSKTCEVIPKIGEACEWGGFYACTKDAFCESTVCIARKAIGDACGRAPADCVVGSYCNATSRTCTAVPAPGTPCTTSHECGNRGCMDGKCEASSNVGLLCGG